MLRNLFSGTCLMLTCAGPSLSATVDYNFSSANGSYAGTIFGLDDTITTAQLPTSIVITASPIGGLGEYIWKNGFGTGFTLISGVLTATFWEGYLPTSPRSCSMDFFGNSSALGCPDVNSIRNTVTYALVDPSPVPLPAGFALLLTGAAALLGLSRFKGKRAVV